jgi:hypothetical protein
LISAAITKINSSKLGIVTRTQRTSSTRLQSWIRAE